MMPPRPLPNTCMPPKKNPTPTSKDTPHDPKPDALEDIEETAMPGEPAESESVMPAEPSISPRSRTGKPTGPTIIKSTTPKKRSPIPVWVWVVVGVVLLSGAALAGMVFFRPSPAPINTNTVAHTNTEQLFPRAIDGVMVTPARANTNLYAAMIENAVESRPPSGLDKASLVYETLAEGGITRFMAMIPLGVEIKELGPIRSARPYYVSWAEEYKPLYIHVGGSPQALDYIKYNKPNLFDFNQFYRSTNFWRDKTRKAPHNVYTNTEKLFIGLRAQVKDFTPSYATWQFQDEPGIEARPETVKDVVVDFSSFNYRVIYRYNRGENLYYRFMGDDSRPHVTRDGSKITAKNVIVQYVKVGLLAKEKERLDIQVIGEGRAILFRDGKMIDGTWKKTSAKDRTMYFDATGSPMVFDRGTTWIDVLPADRVVTY